jgi:predicted nucleic acid-binding protein
MTATTTKYLVDTNILVYAYERSSSVKQSRALEVLERLVQTGSGALSTQVLSEFYVVATRKLNAPLSVDEALARVEYYLTNWIVLNIAPLTIREALRGLQRYQLSYWDALVWATARTNGLPAILTEDLNIGASLDGVQIINPLDEKVDLSLLS